MPKTNHENPPEYLSPEEEQFARLKCVEGMKLHEVYKELHPKSRMSKSNMAKEAWKIWQKIKGKVGSWSEWFEKYDVGPDRLIKVFDEGLQANQTIIVGGKVAQVPDHRTRGYFANQVKDIFGLAEQTVNVKIDKPLPLIVVTSDDDIPTDD
jgi:hypothetical protein